MLQMLMMKLGRVQKNNQSGKKKDGIKQTSCCTNKNNSCRQEEMKMNKKGFTLTEILIVLVVAGILLALILPNTLLAIDRANRTADQANVKTLQTAVFMCYTATRVWADCASQADLITGHYIERQIVSPYPNEDYTFTVLDDVQGAEGVGVVVSSTLDQN